MNLNNNLLKRIFATTTVFATLLTAGVSSTAHADNNTSNQQNVKTKVDEASKKYGYYARKNYSDFHYSSTTIFQYNKYPSQMQVLYNLGTSVPDPSKTYYRLGSNNIFIDGCEINLNFNGGLNFAGQDGRLSQSNYDAQNKFLVKHGMDHLWLKLVTYMQSKGNILGLNDNNVFFYVNINQFYRRFLHIDIDKIMTNTQPKNWQTKYKNWEPTKGVVKDGYSLKWVSNKIDWAFRHKKQANKEILKIVKETKLKDQSQSNATGKFDNTTMIK